MDSINENQLNSATNELEQNNDQVFLKNKNNENDNNGKELLEINDRVDSEETILLTEYNDTESMPIACASSTIVSTESDSQTGLQKLLNKQKLELAFELRRLQFANRPVSNTDSKKNLEEFFNENLATSNNNAASAAKPVKDPKKFRSEATRNEIEELSNSARVSNVLLTARQRLENALQRITRSSANIPISIPTPPPLASTLNQSAAYSNGLHASQNSVVSNISSNLVVHSSDGSANVFTPVTAWIPLTSQPPQSQAQQETIQPTVLLNAPGQQWLTVADPQLRTTIDDLRRETIIEEISELVHQQLVTSTLESEFRTQLEERVMQHLQASGHDGNRTRDFIRNIQQSSQIERNDFSNLGIFTAPANQIPDNLDSASTYQASQNAQALGQRQATASNSREIRALKSEIIELKNMMKLSFQLQLDMQRSLKQEISALISNSVNQKLASNTNNQIRFESRINSTQPSNEGSCIICTDGQVDTVLYKCGHMCTCYACSMTLKEAGRNCPVCRAPIVDILRSYKCNLE